MSAQYRLVFQGEVAADQHVAVVRKRLAKLLKADDATLKTLFSGQPVVLKKTIDAAGAAKFQMAFKQAGAKLRVQPLDGAQAAAPKKQTLAERLAAEQAANDEAPAAAASALQEASREGSGEVGNDAAAEAGAVDPETGWRLLPVGSYLLEVDEQPREVLNEVSVEHLTLAEPGARIGPLLDQMADPDALLAAAADFQLAEVGAELGFEAGNTEPESPVAAPDLPVAEPGATLGDASTEETPPLPAPDLSLAEPGARMGSVAEPQTPALPDISHLELVEDPEDD